MLLEDTLLALATGDDARRLVVALCACAREQLPRAETIDPFNRSIVACAERWVLGGDAIQEVRKVRRRAGNTRGATFSTACVAVIVDDRVRRESTVQLFARQLPTAVWMATPAGQAWAARSGPLAQVGQDPSVWQEVVDTDARLAAVASAAVAAPAEVSLPAQAPHLGVPLSSARIGR